MDVFTASGPVRGVVDRGIHRFLGVPYAEPPEGDLRFAPPRRRPPSGDVLECDAPGDVVPQPSGTGVVNEIFNPVHRQGPDCLNLNVWTPDPGAAGLPVLVWLHGGGFTIGSGSDSLYDAAAFARHGVVAVTVNYRLGVLGFHHTGQLADGSGAFGLLDQLAALEWVQENIAAFGGDPALVTIAGESAGAMSVGALLGTPRSAGLFRRAICQSGAAHMNVAPEYAAVVAREVTDRLGIRPDDIDALRAVSTTRLLEVQVAVGMDIASARDVARFGPDVGLSGIAWQPMYRSDVIPQRPIDAVSDGVGSDVDLLIGTNRDEFMLFLGTAEDGDIPASFSDNAIVGAAYSATFGEVADDVIATYRAELADAPSTALLAALETDRFFRMPAIRLAEARSDAKADTHMYLFTWESRAFDGRVGAGHTVEIPFVFDNLDDRMALQLTGGDAPQALASDMHGAWVRFVASGDPGWPAYRLDDRVTKDFGTSGALLSDPGRAVRLAWADIL